MVQSTAKDLGAVGWDPYYGYGRVDAQKAVAVAGPAPILTVGQEQMLFLADVTWGPWPQTLVVGNDAPCGSLDWSAVDDAGWLGESPDSGQTSSSQPAEITVSVDKSGLAQGQTYEANITMSSATPGVVGSPLSVDVKFVYSARPLQRIVFPLAMRT